MLHKLLGVAAVLALVGISPALAQEQTETHQGKVVSVKGDELIMTGPDGKEMTHTLAPDAKVMCDGKTRHLSDLKPGMTVRVRVQPDNPKLALAVDASNGNRADRAVRPTGRPFLGLRLEQTTEGLTVRAVEPGSPAANAGLQAGDVITRIDNQDVKDMVGLMGALREHKAGDKLALDVRRDGKDQELTVTLGERPGFRAREERREDRQERTRETRQKRRAEHNAFLGVGVDALTPSAKEKLGVNIDHGAVVEEVMPNSPAAKAGLQKGDVITKVNARNVTSPSELRSAIHRAGVGKDIHIEAIRGQETKEFDAKLEAAPADSFGPQREK